MPDATKTITVTRKPEEQEVSIDFVQGEYKKGDKKGQTFMHLPVDENNLALIVSWLGVKQHVSILEKDLRLKAQKWSAAATNDEDVFNEEAFKQFAAEFSARGESIENLQEQVQDQLELMEELAAKADATGVLAAAMAIKQLNADIELARRPRKKKTEDTAAPVAATVAA